MAVKEDSMHTLVVYAAEYIDLAENRHVSIRFACGSVGALNAEGHS